MRTQLYASGFIILCLHVTMCLGIWATVSACDDVSWDMGHCVCMRRCVLGYGPLCLHATMCLGIWATVSACDDVSWDMGHCVCMRRCVLGYGPLCLHVTMCLGIWATVSACDDVSWDMGHCVCMRRCVLGYGPLCLHVTMCLGIRATLHLTMLQGTSFFVCCCCCLFICFFNACFILVQNVSNDGWQRQAGRQDGLREEESVNILPPPPPPDSYMVTRTLTHGNLSRRKDQQTGKKSGTVTRQFGTDENLTRRKGRQTGTRLTAKFRLSPLFLINWSQLELGFNIRVLLGCG